MTVRGLVLGKFMPFHQGHQYLIDFARTHCDELIVLVCSIESEPIGGALRYRWVRESCPPEVRVLHVTDEVPQEPSEHEDFWEIWRGLVLRHAGAPIHRVYASDTYGERLAAEVGAAFVPVDIAREHVPVSGTSIRADPLGSWEYLPAAVRPHFVKRVSVFGPESTGKSTLASALSRRFGTVAVREYARGYLEALGRPCEVEDMLPIAQGQVAAEEAMARHARRVLFCDTDPLATTLWSEALFGRCDGPILEIAGARRYDLTLLLDLDLPWVKDPVRYQPDEAARRSFFASCQEALERRGRDYLVIRGDHSERLAAATQAVDALIGGSSLR